MKKASAEPVLKTATLDEIASRPLTKRQREDIAALAAMPDDRIDLSDIPESAGAQGWVRNPFQRPVTPLDYDSAERARYRSGARSLEEERHAVPDVNPAVAS